MPQKLRTIVGGKLELITNNMMWIFVKTCAKICQLKVPAVYSIVIISGKYSWIFL